MKTRARPAHHLIGLRLVVIKASLGKHVVDGHLPQEYLPIGHISVEYLPTEYLTACKNLVVKNPEIFACAKILREIVHR